MPEIISPLDEIVKYAIRCASEGKHDQWRKLNFNGVWRYQLENLTRADASGLQLFQRTLSFLLDAQTLSDINSIDTNEPPPEPPARQPVQNNNDVPDLPAAVRLTAAQERQADEVGQFEREYVAWAGAMANETPVDYEQLIAITLIGLAIGRRCYLAAPWGMSIFPNHYGIIMGTTSYHRKSTALTLMSNIIGDAFPYLLMPRPGSTENFGEELAGRFKTDNCTAEDKTELERARPFAGQRIIIRDEISGLFRSFGRDYMMGMREDLLTMYDAPATHKLSNNSRGVMIARDMAPSLIGATTPAGLSSALTRRDWEDGNLARFALITAEPGYHDRPAPDTFVQPTAFIARLKTLHQRLPAPPIFGMGGKAETWSLIAPIWPEARAYSSALREMTNPERSDSLDNRLRGTYGRHHVRALKIALCLAVMDWSEKLLGNSSETLRANSEEFPHPIVSKAHWYRAQQIAEEWRASAHRFLSQMSVSDDAESNDRVYRHLLRWPEGETKTELLQRTGLSKIMLDSSLETLMESGKIEVFKRKGTRGPEAAVYRACS